jgi:hypothetical protein
MTDLYQEVIFLNASVGLDKMARSSFNYANDYTGNWNDSSNIYKGNTGTYVNYGTDYVGTTGANWITLKDKWTGD